MVFFSRVYIFMYIGDTAILILWPPSHSYRRKLTRIPGTVRGATLTTAAHVVPWTGPDVLEFTVFQRLRLQNAGRYFAEEWRIFDNVRRPTSDSEANFRFTNLPQLFDSNVTRNQRLAYRTVGRDSIHALLHGLHHRTFLYS
jgi:hypothetical protein